MWQKKLTKSNIPNYPKKGYACSMIPLDWEQYQIYKQVLLETYIPAFYLNSLLKKIDVDKKG